MTQISVNVRGLRYGSWHIGRRMEARCSNNFAACRLLKDRKTEDHLFGDKDKFVTAAYKKKLEEDQKWLAEEKIREARDAKQDVTKAGHMGNFYRCLTLVHMIFPNISERALSFMNFPKCNHSAEAHGNRPIPK